METHGAGQILIAVSLVVVLLAPVGVGPATALSPPPCNEATGIARTDAGDWVLSSWDRLEAYNDSWTFRSGVSRPENRSLGVDTGPDGRLWVLEQNRVVSLGDDLETSGLTTIVELPVENESIYAFGDIAYVEEWIVLRNESVWTFDADWSNRTAAPTIERAVPNGTRGFAATNESLTFITANGTVAHYERQTNGTLVQRSRVTLELGDEAADVHPGPNGTWLVVQPGNVTAYSAEWDRLGRRAAVFSPEGCSSTVDDVGTGLFYGAAIFLLAMGAIGLVIVALTAAAGWYVLKWVRS